MATFNYVGGTDRQRAWVVEAMALSTVDWANVLPDSHTVRFEWAAEPPLPGHTEAACTFTDGALSVVTIRNNLDDPLTSVARELVGTDPQAVKRFYQEAVVHELGHVLTFTMMTTEEREAFCTAFTYDGDDGEARAGTAADLNPTEKPWADRIQECMAEIVKDALLPDQNRWADNRTNWRIDRARFEEFFTALIPGDPGDPGDLGVGGFSTSGDQFFYFVEPDTVDQIGTWEDPDVIYANAEAFGRPLIGTDISEVYHFHWDGLAGVIPENARNVQLKYVLRGGGGPSFHLVSTGHQDDPDDPTDSFVPAVYEWPPTDLELNDMVVGNFPIVGDLHLFDSRGTMTYQDYRDIGTDDASFNFLFELPVDPGDVPGPGVFDFTSHGWKAGVDPPYNWSGYGLRIFFDFRPHIHYSYDVPGEGATDPVPPTPAVVPPWPYTDPFVAAGGGDASVFRTR